MRHYSDGACIAGKHYLVALEPGKVRGVLPPCCALPRRIARELAHDQGATGQRIRGQSFDDFDDGERSTQASLFGYHTRHRHGLRNDSNGSGGTQRNITSQRENHES